jgi:alpha,alpha-trehalase
MDNDFSKVLDYIESCWQTNSMQPGHPPFASPRNLAMHFARKKLPNPYISPNNKYFAGTQFYWDSYFTILGLVSTGRVEIAKNMVDNLLFLFDKFGLMPARNSWTSLGRTQPPYLTRMAFEVYENGGANDEWMNRVMSYALQEYENVWLGGQRLNQTSGLSLYKPKYFSRLLKVYESGWDLSNRFSGLAHEVLPVDLNCLLYQYEKDFLAWAKHKKDRISAERWQVALKRRKELINKYFWDAQTGFYYDHNLKTKKHEKLRTLAGFFPLWCGAADKKQAKACRELLKVFEQKGGLATTEKMAPTHRQWDYPNGWPPLQYIVIEGLRNYGFDKDAKRLAKKWLNLNQKVFEETGKLWEKYDVVYCRKGLPGRYPTQSDFSWTMAVFIKLVAAGGTAAAIAAEKQ